MHARAHTDTQPHVYAYTCAFTHMHRQMHTCVCVHIHMHTRVHSKQLSNIALHLLRKFLKKSDGTQCRLIGANPDKNNVRKWYNFWRDNWTHPWKPPILDSSPVSSQQAATSAPTLGRPRFLRSSHPPGHFCWRSFLPQARLTWVHGIYIFVTCLFIQPPNIQFNPISTGVFPTSTLRKEWRASIWENALTFTPHFLCSRQHLLLEFPKGFINNVVCNWLPLLIAVKSSI